LNEFAKPPTVSHRWLLCKATGDFRCPITLFLSQKPSGNAGDDAITRRDAINFAPLQLAEKSVETSRTK
jgi:hypothetical protein